MTGTVVVRFGTGGTRRISLTGGGVAGRGDSAGVVGEALATTAGGVAGGGGGVVVAVVAVRGRGAAGRLTGATGLAVLTGVAGVRATTVLTGAGLAGALAATFLATAAGFLVAVFETAGVLATALRLVARAGAFLAGLAAARVVVRVLGVVCAGRLAAGGFLADARRAGDEAAAVVDRRRAGAAVRRVVLRVFPGRRAMSAPSWVI
jgi:hypothetical protein